MKSLSNKTFTYFFSGVALALTALLAFPASGFAATPSAAKDTFCKDLPGIEERIKEKKAGFMEKLQGLQEKHGSSFSYEKDRLSVFTTSLQGRKVTPEFTETKKREALRNAQAMEERREKAASYFTEHKERMEEVLTTVASMHEEAFDRAYEECSKGTDPVVIKEAFKADMKAIQSHIREEGTELKAQKEETLGAFSRIKETQVPRTLRSFFSKPQNR